MYKFVCGLLIIKFNRIKIRKDLYRSILWFYNINDKKFLKILRGEKRSIIFVIGNIECRIYWNNDLKVLRERFRI